MKIVVLSDTHIPERAKDLPKEAYEDLQDANLILHAGDFTSEEFLKKLQKITEVKAVSGNMDESQLKNILPKKLVLTIGAFTVGIVHGWGAPSGLVDLVQEEFSEQKPNIIIFGHSHQPLNIFKNNTLLFNPGSPTDKFFANNNSYGIININGEIKAEIIRI